MATDDKIRTIRLKEKTYQKFIKLGTYYETADDILNKIIDGTKGGKPTKKESRIERQI